MFQQLLTPVAGSLGLSFIVAILPVVTVLVLLGIARRPAWQAALAGLIVGLIVAPATKIAQVVNAPAAKVARVIAAYAAKSAVESAVESGEGAAA